MTRVTFTSALHRHVHAPSVDVKASTVREALEGAFAMSPELRGYVLDDQGGVRKHIEVFVGATRIVDRSKLSDGVAPGAEIHVMQALSGG